MVGQGGRGQVRPDEGGFHDDNQSPAFQPTSSLLNRSDTSLQYRSISAKHSTVLSLCSQVIPFVFDAKACKEQRVTCGLLPSAFHFVEEEYITWQQASSSCI